MLLSPNLVHRKMIYEIVKTVWIPNTYSIVIRQFIIFKKFQSYLDGRRTRCSYLFSFVSDGEMDLSLFEDNENRSP